LSFFKISSDYLNEDFFTSAPNDGAYFGFALIKKNTKTKVIADNKKYAA
jgi:hypothetical protein